MTCRFCDRRFWGRGQAHPHAWNGVWRPASSPDVTWQLTGQQGREKGARGSSGGPGAGRRLSASSSTGQEIGGLKRGVRVPPAVATGRSRGRKTELQGPAFIPGSPGEVGGGRAKASSCWKVGRFPGGKSAASTGTCPAEEGRLRTDRLSQEVCR